jgi:hypothetical protein
MVNHQGITFLAEQVSGMKLSLPKGLVQILCQPMLLLVLLFTNIFSGKSSSSNGCCAL